AGVIDRVTDAARPAPSPPRRRGWSPRAVAWGSSAQRHVDLLAAAHHDDAPEPGRRFRGLVEIAGFGDLLVVDRKDDVALLESDAGRGAAVDEIDHHNAFGLGIQMQLVG